MMGVMTTQQLLPLTPAGAVLIGDATALVTDDDGGRVFIRGELCNAWDAGDDLGRRLAAVQLVRIKAARAMAVATAFGVTTVTLWRWRRELDTSGAQGLAQDKRGPKGPSRLTPEVVADIRSRRRGGGCGYRQPPRGSTVMAPWGRACPGQGPGHRRCQAPCASATR